MKISLAKSAGFCFGVKRAINIAKEISQTNENIEMLGDIVHNAEVVKQIRNAGIKKIGFLKEGRNKILLIRAHGAGRLTLQKAAALGYKIIDATCPMVKEIHRIAKKMEEEGYKIIIIGDKLHDEVKGITGQLAGKAIVIDRKSSIPFRLLKKINKAAIVVQSTQDIDKVKKIFEAVKPHIKSLRFFNTICKPTTTKQMEIKSLPLKNDTIIIIGSKTSANTKRLYEIAKSLNKRSYWIQSKEEIKKAWFKGARKIGVASGASTPDSTTQEVIDHIKKISAGLRS